MWEKVISYMPHWQVFYKAFSIFIPYLIYKLFHVFYLLIRAMAKLI